MTPQEYKKLTLAQMQEIEWVTARPIESRVQRIEAGRPVKIVAKRGGLSLSSEECKCCGVSFFVRGCEPSSVKRAL